jgi:hypothetical protein
MALQIEHPIQSHIRTNAIEVSLLGFLYNLVKIPKRFIRQGSRDPLPSVVANRQAPGQMSRNSRSWLGRFSWCPG